MDYHVAQRVFGWTLFWFTLYRTFGKIFKKRKPEYNCRIVTLLHAVVITVVSCADTFFSGTNPYSVLGLSNTYPQIFIITASLGYFFYDFTWCLYHQTEGPVMLLHHVISITFMSVCLILQVSGTEVVATVFGSEITSIVLNIRWFLKEHELYSDTTIGLIVDLLFVVLFLGVRMGVGGTLCYSVVTSPRPPTLVKIGGSAFFAVNCLFFVQILSFSRYRFAKWVKKRKQADEKIQEATGKLNGTTKHTFHGDTLRNRKNRDQGDQELSFENSPFLTT